MLHVRRQPKILLWLAAIPNHTIHDVVEGGACFPPVVLAVLILILESLLFVIKLFGFDCAGPKLFLCLRHSEPILFISIVQVSGLWLLFLFTKASGKPFLFQGGHWIGERERERLFIQANILVEHRVLRLS